MINAHFGPLENDVKVSLLPRFGEAEIEALGMHPLKRLASSTIVSKL
jgi:hypothetical protein